MPDITPFETYKLFMCIKLHFTTDYDFFKYRGKLKVTEDNFNKRKDRLKFVGLSRKYSDPLTLTGLFVSNMVAGHKKKWIQFFLSKDARDTFNRWVVNLERLDEFVATELQRIIDENEVENIGDIFEAKEGGHPLILVYCIADLLSLETLIVCCDFFDLQKSWNGVIVDTVIWPEISKSIDKYRPFLKYDRDKLKTTIDNLNFKK